jgi:isoleucyl-tRNA synthetase
MLIDKDLEERMELAQNITSMVLSLRKKNNIRVRQPLNKIMIPVLSDHFRQVLTAVEDLILSEVNIKKLDYLTEDSTILVKKIKPNFKTLGPKYGKIMKQLASLIQSLSQENIREMERTGEFNLNVGGEMVHITAEDVEITTEDIEGWSVANQDHLTVAMDLHITPELHEEGLARELVNRIQNMRKDKGLEVTDHILLQVEKNEKTDTAFANFKEYICSETLAKMELAEKIANPSAEMVELVDGISVKIGIVKEY